MVCNSKILALLVVIETIAIAGLIFYNFSLNERIASLEKEIAIGKEAYFGMKSLVDGITDFSIGSHKGLSGNYSACLTYLQQAQFELERAKITFQNNDSLSWYYLLAEELSRYDPSAYCYYAVNSGQNTATTLQELWNFARN